MEKSPHCPCHGPCCDEDKEYIAHTLEGGEWKDAAVLEKKDRFDEHDNSSISNGSNPHELHDPRNLASITSTDYRRTLRYCALFRFERV